MKKKKHTFSFTETELMVIDGALGRFVHWNEVMARSLEDPAELHGDAEVARCLLMRIVKPLEAAARRVRVAELERELAALKGPKRKRARR